MSNNNNNKTFFETDDQDICKKEFIKAGYWPNEIFWQAWCKAYRLGWDAGCKACTDDCDCNGGD